MKLSRRDFLKFSELAALTCMPLHYSPPSFTSGKTSNAPNFLIITFDAFSAMNCSIYGYPRNTTPLLESISKKAIVYHNHFTGSSFTTPGTASLLTGTLPWTHRAINPYDPVIKPLIDHNVFQLFASDYYRLGYTHNPLADVLLRQFIPYMDKFIPREKLFLTNYWVSQLFNNDFNIAFIAALNAIEDYRTVVKSSVYLSEIHSYLLEPMQEKAADPYKAQFPRDLPNVRGKYFLLEDGIDWLNENLVDLPEPFLGYFHFLPPHEPYNTRKEFINIHLGDGYTPINKPEHLFSMGRSYQRLTRDRRLYDEFINYVDSEFHRLYQSLESSGVLNNTWLILTSDHGEMFERGILGHNGSTLHQPLARIPLVIFPPGQTERIDINVPTSAVDLVPTLLHVTGREIPSWVDGYPLPPFGEITDRPVYTIFGRNKQQNTPFKSMTGMIVQENMKLVYYHGYPILKNTGDFVELFDIKNDPEEMIDLSGEDTGSVKRLLEQLKNDLAKAEAIYE